MGTPAGKRPSVGKQGGGGMRVGALPEGPVGDLVTHTGPEAGHLNLDIPGGVHVCVLCV